ASRREGSSNALCRKAELRWNAEAKANELFSWDGTGAEVVYGPFGPGQYRAVPSRMAPGSGSRQTSVPGVATEVWRLPLRGVVDPSVNRSRRLAGRLPTMPRALALRCVPC